MTPPQASIPVILEKTAARRMVWVDVAPAWLPAS